MDDQLRLGFDPLDNMHEEFDLLLNVLLSASDADLASVLDAMQAHLVRHFALEEEWMNNYEFPPRDCHIQEHAAVMKSVQEVQTMLRTEQAGALGAARGLVAALDEWFPGHATHLDSALAHWMCKRQFGGKPVVFRRRIEAAG